MTVSQTAGSPAVDEARAAVTVSGLRVSYVGRDGSNEVLHGIDFVARRGRTLALVGESGSGKTTTAMSIAALLPKSALLEGHVDIDGDDILALGARQIEDLRGEKVAVIFQNPMTSLNPTMRVGEQIAEQVRRHTGSGQAESRNRAVELMDSVQINDPAATARKYPHELSGGMRQRIVIAMAISCNPNVLIADEPTTALDVTVQAQILGILRDLRDQRGMTLLLVTHDMGVVAQLADDVAVMYDGNFVEFSSAAELFSEPLHPYTKGLLEAQPRLDDDEARTRRLPTIPKSAPMLDRLPSGLAVVGDGKLIPGQAPIEERRRFVRIGDRLIAVEGAE